MEELKITTEAKHYDFYICDKDGNPVIWQESGKDYELSEQVKNKIRQSILSELEDKVKGLEVFTMRDDYDGTFKTVRLESVLKAIKE